MPHRLDDRCPLIVPPPCKSIVFLLPFAMCAALPRADYYESSALGVVRLRPSRLAQFRSGQTIRVPAFRSTTCVPLGGELYPWRCGGWAHESASHPRCVPRIQQQGVTSLAASDRSASTAIAAFGGKFPQIQRRQSLTSLSRHRHCGSPACSRWSTSGTVTHQSVIKTTFLLYHAAVSAIAGG